MLADIPFDTTDRRNGSDGESEMVLTRNMSRGTELSSHDRIHLDHDLLLLCHEGVALFNLLCHPSSEVVTNHSGTDIHNPLFRHFGEVLLIWKVVGHLRPCADEVGDAFKREVLILRNVDRLHLSVVEIGLLGAQDVLQKVDRHVL